MKEELLISALECKDCYENYSEKSYFLDILKQKSVKKNRSEIKFLHININKKILIIHRISNISFFSKNIFSNNNLEDIIKSKTKGHTAKANISKYDFWFLVDDTQVKVFYINKFAFLLAYKVMAKEDIIEYIENISQRVEDIVRSTELYIERERKKFNLFTQCDALYKAENILYIVHIGSVFFVFENIEETVSIINEFPSHFSRSKIYKVVKNKLLKAIDENHDNLKEIFLKECTEEVLNYKNNPVGYLYFYYKITNENSSYVIKQLKNNLSCNEKHDTFNVDGFYYLFSGKVIVDIVTPNNITSSKVKNVKNALEIHLDKSIEKIISRIDYYISTFSHQAIYFKNNEPNVNEKNVTMNKKITDDKSIFSKLCDLYVDCNGVLELAIKGNYYYESDVSGNLTIHEEPTNRFDRYALVVRNKNNDTVGYISKEIAKDFLYRKTLLKCTKQIKISEIKENTLKIILDPHLILMSLRK